MQTEIELKIVSCLEQESKMNDFVFFLRQRPWNFLQTPHNQNHLGGKKREKPFLFQS